MLEYCLPFKGGTLAVLGSRCPEDGVCEITFVATDMLPLDAPDLEVRISEAFGGKCIVTGGVKVFQFWKIIFTKTVQGKIRNPQSLFKAIRNRLERIMR